MNKSTLEVVPQSQLHVAILLDGNGRWAASHGLRRSEGHRAGVEAVRRVVRAAPGVGIGTLTLYAFSSDNWGRPLSEVGALLNLLEEYFHTEASHCAAENVRLRVIGRRDRIPPSLAAAIETAERLTAHCRGLQLRIAVDYSSRDAILRAACWMMSSVEVSQREFAKRLGEVTNAPGPALDVDLLIRTGGDRRLSDFMLWECAYAELFFTPRMWPDFGQEDLAEALEDFQGRERRFGLLPEAAVS